MNIIFGVLLQFAECLESHNVALIAVLPKHLPCVLLSAQLTVLFCTLAPRNDSLHFHTCLRTGEATSLSDGSCQTGGFAHPPSHMQGGLSNTDFCWKFSHLPAGNLSRVGLPLPLASDSFAVRGCSAVAAGFLEGRAFVSFFVVNSEVTEGRGAQEVRSRQ